MKPLLLVVENDSGTRRLLDVYLRREGFEVDPVATGSDALMLLDRVDYAAVILDLLIPGRTGGDVLDELASRRPELLDRIVVISSATEARLRDLRGRYPAVAALRKPFDLGELLASVRQRVVAHAPPDPAQTFARLSVVAGAKAGVVARRDGEALDLITSFGDPQGIAESLRAEGAAVLAVPIGAGIAAWTFPEPRVFDDEARARLAAIAAGAAELLGA